MLEVHKELVAHGDTSELDDLLTRLTEHLVSGWTRDAEAEDRLEQLGAGERQYVFRCAARTDRPAVSLFMAKGRDALEVTNIVPQESGSLTRAQYNSALDEFAEKNVRPIASRLGLEVSVTADRQPITHWLSEEATRRLQSFSGAANKGTGSSHPLDFRRWAAFLIKVHQENASLDSGTLQRWLIEEEGWPEEKASELAIEFEFSRDLLRAYDAER